MARETIIQTIPVPTHGRYIIDLPDGDGPFPLLVGFHGYAENAERNLESLRRIPESAGWMRVAVQGLHSFYNSRSSEVVASWMTRLHRELAIADNIAYIRSVVRALRAEHRVGAKLVFAGFSQGASMAYRAAAAVPCDGVVILGGDLPPELRELESLPLPPVLVGRGDDDQSFSAEVFERDLQILRTKGAAVEASAFKGGHEWSDSFLAAAGKFLQRVAGADGPTA